jgi:hypothetical protein
MAPPLLGIEVRPPLIKRSPVREGAGYDDIEPQGLIPPQLGQLYATLRIAELLQPG